MILFFSYLTQAQFIPDIISTDNYRPYLTEDQKQGELKPNFKKGYLRTSEELYPELYKYKKTDHLDPLKGTSADPANAFTDYSKQMQFNKPASIPNSDIPTSVYNPDLSIQQKNQAMIDTDMVAYET